MRAVSLIETVLSVLVLGGAFAAVLTNVGSSRAAHAVASERQFATVLAEDLMDEILAQPLYKEDGGVLGPESDEQGGTRAQFDDVDDYQNWSSTPPVDAAGDEIPGADGYRRWVKVRYVEVDDLNVKANSDTGMLVIYIRVLRDGKIVSDLTAYRSDAWQAPEENY